LEAWQRRERRKLRSWEAGKLSKDKDFAVIAVAQLPNFSASQLSQLRRARRALFASFLRILASSHLPFTSLLRIFASWHLCFGARSAPCGALTF